jgi:peptide/nickel transport system permease protein
VFSYIARRVIGMLISVLMVVSVTFLLMQLIPGDPASVLLGMNATPEQIADLKATWGLDQSVFSQFLKYIDNFIRGDFGKSLFYREPVLKMLGARAETSILLGVGSLIVVLGIGIPGGIFAALRPSSWVDRLFLVVSLAGASIPSFWLGLIVMYVFAGKLGWLPSSGFTSILQTGNLANLRSLILPSFSLGFVNAALVARTARSSMLDVMQADYITTARAKGLHERVVTIKHALRNALIPIITVVSFTFAALISGAVVTENVFALPGIGSLIVQSVLKRDYPVIQGIMMIIAVLYVLVNFITDLSYAFVDPRIRYR